MSMESHGEVILTGENLRTLRETCHSPTYTTNTTCTDPGANSDLLGERPATDHLSHGTALVSFWYSSRNSQRHSYVSVYCVVLFSIKFGLIFIFGCVVQSASGSTKLWQKILKSLQRLLDVILETAKRSSDRLPWGLTHIVRNVPACFCNSIFSVLLQFLYVQVGSVMTCVSLARTRFYMYSIINYTVHIDDILN
jgi:hypothetical protein